MKIINNENYEFSLTTFEGVEKTIKMNGKDIVQLLTCHNNVLIDNHTRFIVMKGGAFIDQKTLDNVLKIEQGVKLFELTSQEQNYLVNFINSVWMSMPRYMAYIIFIEKTLKELPFIKRMLYDSDKDCFQLTFK